MAERGLTSAHRHGGFVTTGGPCPSGCEDPAAAESTISWPESRRTRASSQARRADPAMDGPTRSSVRTRTLIEVLPESR